MREMIRLLVHKKYFHICIMIVMIAIILFTLGIIVLRYNVEGETNMPFNLSKITIISSSEGIDKDSGENKWAFDINQNNDIYMYIEKNKQYTKEEAIKSINITNISVEKQKQKGNIMFYKPDQLSENTIFQNKDENRIDKIEYIGDMESNVQNLKISNQGGIVAFRYANDKIAEYISNDEEINHSNLLKKANVIQEDLTAKLYFNIKIKVESGTEYQADISLDLPVNNVIEEGTTSTEMTELDDIIFKRI